MDIVVRANTYWPLVEPPRRTAMDEMNLFFLGGEAMGEKQSRIEKNM